MQHYENISHTFAPVYDERSEVLILGSFPSVKSREYGFYYGHPQNRFWRVLAGVLGTETPETVEQKRRLLLDKHIALWDTVASCSVTGSGDASIRGVVPNDIASLLRAAPVKAIFTNGSKAHELYRRHILPTTGVEAVKLPSTSPANAAWSLERLCSKWEKIKP